MTEPVQAWLPLVPEEQMDPQMQAFMARGRETATPTQNFMRVLANHPEAYLGVMTMWKAVFWEGEVEHEIKEACRLLVAHTHRCRN